ncbi:MAG: VOC family protein [Chloroflexi bacterium]|nr:VOC family protein [Chloroflexota bacterium]
MLANAEAMTVIPAEDTERAAKFYTEKLGLEALTPVTDEFTIFSAGSGTKILMYKRERTKAEHTVLTFIVDDVEAVMKGLIENGVTPEMYDMPGFESNEFGVVQVEEVQSGFFKDTEGNIISVATLPPDMS